MQRLGAVFGVVTLLAGGGGLAACGEETGAHSAAASGDGGGRAAEVGADTGAAPADAASPRRDGGHEVDADGERRDVGPVVDSGAGPGPDAKPTRDASSGDGGPADLTPVADASATDAADGAAPGQDGGAVRGRDSGQAPPFADTDFCAEVQRFGPLYRDTVERWAAQDEASLRPAGSLLLVGSSSVRRWEAFAELYAPYRPLQRGFGGAQLGEVALFAESLVVRHRPAAVAVFAGTNDVAAGVAADVVVERFRCLRQRIGLGLGWQLPVLFIGITPTPSRWANWEVASAVNEAVAALRADDPALHYVDVATAFLETGSPPAEHLFVDDLLHLSELGYALWHEALLPAVQASMAPLPHHRPDAPPLRPGERIRIDLGPDSADDGERTPSPDYLGAHWNNWHSLPGDGAALAGERLAALVTTAGRPTPVELVVAGGFVSNGWANGGLRWPNRELLGDLAVGSATGDFLYTDGPDMPGALVLRNLDPGAAYTLRGFASRADDARRVTELVVTGAAALRSVATAQTSGPGAGSDGSNGNDDDILELTDLRPDAWGQLFVDVRVAEGAFGYLSLLEVVAQQ